MKNQPKIYDRPFTRNEIAQITMQACQIAEPDEESKMLYYNLRYASKDALKDYVAVGQSPNSSYRVEIRTQANENSITITRRVVKVPDVLAFEKVKNRY